MADTVEPRKATDILLAVEAKLDQLIHLVRSQDLNIKIISNKLNNLIEEVHSFSEEDAPPDVSYNNVQPFLPEKVSISPDFVIPMEISPTGFRRTSRPETFSSVNNNEVIFKEIPEKKLPETELLFNPKKQINKNADAQVKNVSSTAQQTNSKKPVVQRVVDENGKSVFLAAVEIFNAQSNALEHATRTNQVGKWQANLLPGKYKVTVKKQESLSKKKIDITQQVEVNSLAEIQEIPALICK